MTEFTALRLLPQPIFHSLQPLFYQLGLQGPIAEWAKGHLPTWTQMVFKKTLFFLLTFNEHKMQQMAAVDMLK